MKRTGLSLNERLDVELAEKTPAASIAFIIAASIFLYAHFPGLNDPVTRFSAIIIIFACLGRILMSRKALTLEHYHPKLFFWLKIMIAINGFFWGAIFLPTIDILNSSSLNGGFLLLSITAMTASSVITLSSSLVLAYLFQWSLLVPTAVIAWMKLNDQSNQGDWSFAIMMVIFILYLIKQTKDSRKQLIRTFTHEINLENSLEDLRKSNDRIVEETAKSQHASRLAAVGEIAGGIAHEINNPLTVVLSSIEHLENIYTEDIDLFHKNFLTRTSRSKTAIERINRIIRGLRTFSQQSDHLPKRWVPIKEILNDTIEFCGEKMNHAGIAFSSSIHNQEAKVLCNPVQISQVLLNLLNNSIYALSKDQGSGERWIKVDVSEAAGFIAISVSDSGKGIPKEHQIKLFQPFFTTKELGEGTGLGLSISQSILREHNGDIRYDDKSPNTRFIFRLPLEDQG